MYPAPSGLQEVDGLNHLLGSPRPVQMRKVGQQVVRRLPFQPLQQPTDRYLRRDRHEQVHVVLGYMALHDLDLVLGTDISDQIPHSRGHFSTQGSSSILRYPDPMQMDLEHSMRATSESAILQA